MKQVLLALILWGAFSPSPAMAQTEEQGRRHEQQHQEEKEVRAKKGMPMKDEMKQKMKEKMQDMKCCATEEQKEPKS